MTEIVTIADARQVEFGVKNFMKSNIFYFWLGVGVALGAGVGAAFGNIAVGAGIGTAIGAAIGFMMKKKQIFASP